ARTPSGSALLQSCSRRDRRSYGAVSPTPAGHRPPIRWPAVAGHCYNPRPFSSTLPAKDSSMDYDKVQAGKSLPDDINVVIEIPANSNPIKYEIDKDSHAVFVDRFMATPMFYPANYGYIPHTLSEDGDPLDVLVVTPYP